MTKRTVHVAALELLQRQFKGLAKLLDGHECGFGLHGKYRKTDHLSVAVEMRDALGSTTIADLVNRQPRRQVLQGQAKALRGIFQAEKPVHKRNCCQKGRKFPAQIHDIRIRKLRLPSSIERRRRLLG